ncbi:MAG: alpha/beta hydrolase [Alphaproteobacteria bacterium]|nr:alpha/beta hydrolase [Alphaproteobacteria bacterium]
MDIILSGANGRIQASYYKNPNPKAPIAVVFHDAPSNGGSMNEKVNYTIFYSFLQKGFSVIRFNFRGIGGTEGVFEAGEGELTDASTVVDWIQEQNEEASDFWLAGVGFGSWVAMQILMRRIEVSGYIAVSPSPKKYDFGFFNPAPCEGLIVGAGADSSISDDMLKGLTNFINKQNFAQTTYKSIPNADKHYEGKLKDLFNIINSYLDKHIKK